MSITNMVKNIKEIHPKTLLLFKVGAYCEAYGRDSYIISYLFDYQIKQKGENDIPKVGFSKRAIPRVLSKIEEEKIDYLLIDVRNNYNVDDKVENKNLNNYDTMFEKSHKYVKKQRKFIDYAIMPIGKYIVQNSCILKNYYKPFPVIVVFIYLQLIFLILQNQYPKQCISQSTQNL